MTHIQRVSEGERLTPAQAFGIVGNETRLQILQVLHDEKGRPMTFSELRKRVGMRDGSQFNYHLKKLDGPFIRKADVGYEIRHAGINVIRTIVDGSFTDHPRIAPFETGGTCVACGASLHAEYEHEMVFVSCSSCQTMHTMGTFPPGGIVRRTDHEVLAAFDQWQRHDFDLFSRGVCSACGGRTDGTLIRDVEDIPIKVDLEATDFLSFDLGIKYQCEQCWAWDYGTAGRHLLTHPVVIAFHSEHGIDLTTVPYWELDWVVSNQRTSVVGENPFGIEVTIPLANEELRVTLDESFAVQEIDRRVAPS